MSAGPGSPQGPSEEYRPRHSVHRDDLPPLYPPGQAGGGPGAAYHGQPPPALQGQLPPGAHGRPPPAPHGQLPPGRHTPVSPPLQVGPRTSAGGSGCAKAFVIVVVVIVLLGFVLTALMFWWISSITGEM